MLYAVYTLLIHVGMFMFGAGQGTSAKLLGNSMKYLVEDQELQSRLRALPKAASVTWWPMMPPGPCSKGTSHTWRTIRRSAWPRA